MDNSIVEKIQTGLAGGKNVGEIFAELKSQGLSDDEINRAFAERLQTNTNVEQAAKPARKHFDTTKAFIMIGTILILVATIIVVAANWTNVGPLARVSFLAIPMLALFGISMYLKKNKLYEEPEKAIFGVAGFMIPFVIGTLIYQFEIYHEVNPILFIICALSALIFFAISEFIFKRHHLAGLTILSSYALFFSILANAEPSEIMTSWLMLGFSLAILALGFVMFVMNSDSKRAFVAVGTIFSAVMLPIAVITSLDQSLVLGSESYAVIISLVGVLYLGLASLYNHLKNIFKDRSFYVLKRLFEEFAPFLMLIPFLALGSDKEGYFYFTAIVGLAFILLAAKIFIYTLPYVGALSLIVSIVALTGKYFANSLGWPVIIFIVGFIAIGAGLLIRKMSKLRKEEGTAQSWLGLGVEEDDQALSGQRFGIGRIILFLIFIWVAIQATVMLISGLLFNRFD
jgi:hypothetical protein